MLLMFEEPLDHFVQIQYAGELAFEGPIRFVLEVGNERRKQRKKRKKKKKKALTGFGQDDRKV